MAVPNRDPSQTKYAEQYMENASYDETFDVLTRLALGHDGQSLQRLNADALATKITTSGSVTYIAIAKPGTAQSSASWQAKKIDSTDANNVTITWADSGNFSQVATDLTALTYS